MQLKRILGNTWLQLVLGLIAGVIGVIVSYPLAILFYIKYAGFELFFGMGDSGDYSPITFVFAAVLFILTFTFPTFVWFFLNRFGNLKAANKKIRTATFLLFVTLPLWIYLGWQTSSKVQTAAEKYYSVRVPCVIKDGVNTETRGETTKEFECKNGVLNGFTKTYNAQGVLVYEGIHSDGKLNGTEIVYYDDGKVKISTTFEHGEKQGPEVFYNGDGSTSLYIINDQGKSHQVYYQSPERFYNVYNSFDLESQKILCKNQGTDPAQYYSYSCRNNLINGEFIRYDSKGNVFFRAKLTDGVLDGIYERFRDGKLVSHLEFKNGRLDGKVLQYSIEGTLEYEGQYKDGLQDGTFRRYDYQGNIESEVVFESGKLVTIIKFYSLSQPLVLSYVFIRTKCYRCDLLGVREHCTPLIRPT